MWMWWIIGADPMKVNAAEEALALPHHQVHKNQKWTLKYYKLK